MSIRSLLHAVKVAATTPYDTIHLKVFYPDRMSDRPRLGMGGVPADPQQAS